MAYSPLEYNPTLKRRRLSSTDLATLQSFANYDYTVGTGGQMQFVVASGVISPGNNVDVYWNGILMREGVTPNGFVRNSGANRIDMTQTIPEGAWVKIRVWRN
jgi:hypothetical protein